MAKQQHKPKNKNADLAQRNPEQHSKSIFVQYPFFTAVAVNFLFFLITYTIYTPFFQTNDDPGMMLEAAGISLSPEPTEYLLFTNIILGLILKNLYILMPSIAWYGYYLLFSLFLGNTAILYVLLRRNPHALTIILYTFYFVIISTYTLISMQFTVTGFVCGLGGLALIFMVPSQSDKSLKIREIITIPAISGALLSGLSLMIRTESIALAMVLFSPIIVIEFYRQRKLFVPKIISFGLIIIFCFPLYVINHVSYSSPEWKEANAFRTSATQFVDNHVMSKASEEKRKEAMDKVGWRPIDNAMLSFWFFIDEEIYSTKKLDTILSILENEMDTNEIDKYLSDVVYEQKIVKRAMIIALFFTVFLLVRTDDKILLGMNIGFVLLAYIGIHYLLWALHYFYKQAPPHVYISSYLFLATFPLLLLHEKFCFNPFKSSFDLRFVGAAVLGVVMFYYSNIAHKEIKNLSKQAKSNVRNLNQVVKAMKPTEESLFVVWANSFPYENISPFSNLDFMRSLNLLSLGSIQRTPIVKSVLNKFDTKNIYTAIPNRKNIYLVVHQVYQKQYNWVGLYNQFMYEHYQKQIDAQLVLQAGNVMVFDVKYK